MTRTLDSLKWRYATKQFDTNKLLSVEKMNLIKEAFNLTATSYGLQPVKLLILSDKDLQQDLVKHTMNQVQLAQASHVLVFCIQLNIDKDYITQYFKRIKEVRDTNDAILTPFKNFLIDDFEGQSQLEIENWATKQAYLIMGNLLTVCAIEGIDACPMEGFAPEKYDEILKLKAQNLKSVLVMPIGYRAEGDMFARLKKVRKELDSSIIEL
ncbi:MAG: NAD(P)H-dependent oxidoreductase [Bacteroidetes bacterium]|nr:MAG: NAD(P)H-dependent oxidoreductase [Bacteroidota bacterium]